VVPQALERTRGIGVHDGAGVRTGGARSGRTRAMTTKRSSLP
jgi:hypothetical protein